MKRRNIQVLFIKGNGATLYRSANKESLAAEYFELNETDYLRFSEIIKTAPSRITHILVDVLEEEYHLATAPHISPLNPDHKPHLDRIAERTLRGAPFRYWVVQGRESQGRRDDKILLTGISSKDLLKPWLDAIEQHQGSLGGIISLPLLSQTLMRSLGKMTGSQLLVTKVADNLRLSVFVDGQLKISRITPLRHGTSTAMAEAFIKEVEKTQLYLGRVRLLGPTGKINVHVVGRGMLLELMRCETRDSDAMAWHMIDMADLAKKLSLAGSWDTFDCEGLFAQLVMRRVTVNHYATTLQLRTQRLRKIDGRLRLAGVGIFTAALGLSAWNVAASFDIADRKQALQEQIATQLVAYEKIKTTLPNDLTIDTDDVKAMVQAAQKLKDLKASPHTMLASISAVLKKQPAVAVDRFYFRVVTPDIRQSEFDPQADPLDPMNAPEEVDETGRYLVEEILQINGRLLNFERNYRGAHAALLSFTQSLHQTEQFSRVTILKEPINTSPKNAVEGAYDAREEIAQPEFSIELVRARRHEP